MGGAQEGTFLTDNLSAVLVHIEANDSAGKIRSKSYMSFGTFFTLIGIVTNEKVLTRQHSLESFRHAATGTILKIKKDENLLSIVVNPAILSSLTRLWYPSKLH